ncbi:MAG: phospholipase D-like domain-containing protein [Candidatus Neomarinimicrobiota bacterium]
MSGWAIVAAWLVVVGFYHSVKPLPLGMNYKGQVYHVTEDDIDFLSDISYVDQAGKKLYDHEIADAVLALIDSAENYIFFDIFLFNNYLGPLGFAHRDITVTVTNRLIAKKRSHPDIAIDFITDPVNTFYGGSESTYLEDLSAAGINVIITDLKKLRDNNFLYSPIWRTFFQWFGNTSKGGILSHPFSKDESHVTLRSYLSFLNTKANHRKLIIADNGDSMVSIITSWNAHNASSSFSNVAFRIRGDIWKDLYEIENHVAELSAAELENTMDDNKAMLRPKTTNDSDIIVQIFTEKQIERVLLAHLDRSMEGDTVSVAIFYLSSKKVINSLLRAAAQGAIVRLIMDPNKDGFGFRRIGIPNQPVANHLVVRSFGKINVRWYHTHGEQFHPKFTMIKNKNGKVWVLLGSANLTRAQLNNFNLELNVQVTMNDSSGLYEKINNYYDRLWSNKDGNIYTVDYDVFKSESLIKEGIYRFQEMTGFSTY